MFRPTRNGRRFLRPIIAIVWSAAAVDQAARAGDLSDIGAAVQAHDPYDHHSHAHSSDSILGIILGELLLDVIFWDSPPDQPANPKPIQYPYEFVSFPYANGHNGYLASPITMTIVTQRTSRRIWAEYGSDFDDVESVAGGLLVEHRSGWGLDASWRTYFESLGPDGHDDLSTGDVNLTYRLLGSERGSLRIGVGVPWLEFDGEVDVGASATLGADYFPVRPWVFSFEADAGAVGDAGLFHVRSTVGVQLQHAEIYTGIDHMSIDDHNLTNLVIGLQAWW